MSDLRPKSLSGLLTDRDSALGKLAEEAASRVTLTDHLRNGLETRLGQQILTVNLRDDGTLVVVATGPEWAARLRFENERLLSLARELRPATARVRIRAGRVE
jgi:hypothetical protein